MVAVVCNVKLSPFTLALFNADQVKVLPFTLDVKATFRISPLQTVTLELVITGVGNTVTLNNSLVPPAHPLNVGVTVYVTI